MILKPTLFALSLAWAALAWSADFEFHRPLIGKPIPVPEGASVSVRLSKSSYWLGEFADVTLVLTNSSREPFPYQWEGQPDCDVTITDEKGAVVAHWMESNPSIDGLIALGKVDPGKSMTIAMPMFLNFYPHLQRPGKYTLKIIPDCGWTASDTQKLPAGQIGFALTIPTARQAASYVRMLCRQAKENDLSGGFLSELAYPGYLPELRHQAESGSVAAVVGIISIQTMKASEALVALCQCRSNDVIQQALEGLITRLPPSPDVVARDIADHPQASYWKEEFRKPTLAAARRFLQAKDSGRHATGARLLVALSNDPDSDMFEIRNAMQMEIDEAARMPILDPSKSHQGDEIVQSGSFQALLDAVDVLRARGAHDLGMLEAADRAILFRQLADPNSPRPKDDLWKKTLRESLENDSTMVCQQALRAIPRQLTDEWLPLVKHALEGYQDRATLEIACETAQASGRRELIQPLVQLMEISFDHQVVRVAGRAAWELGARYEVWHAWAERLVDPTIISDAGHNLIGVIAEVGAQKIGNCQCHGTVSMNDRFELRERWRRFLQDHAKELSDGKRFSYKDPLMKPLMVRPSDGQPIFSIRFKGGIDWPK